jgi:hypothetical protein
MAARRVPEGPGGRGKDKGQAPQPITLLRKSNPCPGWFPCRHQRPQAPSVEPAPGRAARAAPSAARRAMRPACLSMAGPTGPLGAALFQIGDEPLGIGRVGGGTRPGLLEVVQGGAGIQEGVTDPANSEEDRDVVPG